MTRRIALALTLHNHQPVGNFGWVIAETYDHAYIRWSRPSRAIPRARRLPTTGPHACCAPNTRVRRPPAASRPQADRESSAVAV